MQIGRVLDELAETYPVFARQMRVKPEPAGYLTFRQNDRMR